MATSLACSLCEAGSYQTGSGQIHLLRLEASALCFNTNMPSKLVISQELMQMVWCAGATAGFNCSLCDAGTYQTKSGQDVFIFCSFFSWNPFHDCSLFSFSYHLLLIFFASFQKPLLFFLYPHFFQREHIYVHIFSSMTLVCVCVYSLVYIALAIIFVWSLLLLSHFIIFAVNSLPCTIL